MLFLSLSHSNPTMTASTPSAATVRKVYRELARLIKARPDAQKCLQILQADFRQPLQPNTVATAEQRLDKAEQKLSFLRMTSVKAGPSGQSGRWIYKDGEKLQSDDKGTVRDAKGKVVSNWDGKNLDPDSVRTHKKLLNRAGFVNNAHAKGVF